VKIDLGCGKGKKEGFFGIDCREFPGVDGITNLGKAPWTFARNFGPCVPAKDSAQLERWVLPESSVEEAHCSHFLEHLGSTDRVQFLNELYRVLVPGGKATIITPHWCSNRAYGDFTHQWPPVSEMMYFYVSKEWRATNAPHTDIEWNPEGYSCHFEASWGYGMRPDLVSRNQEYQQFAMSNYKEVCLDLHATLVARK